MFLMKQLSLSLWSLVLVFPADSSSENNNEEIGELSIVVESRKVVSTRLSVSGELKILDSSDLQIFDFALIDIKRKKWLYLSFLYRIFLWRKFCYF